MDWYLDGDDPQGVSLLRREVMAYLRRHGQPESDFDAAELLFAEAVGNAVRHAGGPAWVSVTWQALQPLLEVHDLGDGFDPELVRIASRHPLGPAPVRSSLDTLPESGRGLFLITHLAPGMEAEAKAGGGMLVSVTLPVSKAPATSHDPPRSRTGVLPSLSEAQGQGGFGRESFLRALVVQLAQAVEMLHGPAAAEAAVAQVAIDVGGQMEEEFRRAKAVVGRMTPEQLGECYVRLKHAIDGDFYVIEATEERIVLGNRRCPFGEVVQKAPALCRMTSGVFGGIAARNTDRGASVLLEERIAVGDPGCRVVVYLDGTAGPDRPGAHGYATPQA